MKYLAHDILTLFDEVSKKSNLSLDHGNFGLISGQINEAGDQSIYITKDYLYKNAFLPARGGKGDPSTEISLNQAYVNRIAQFLGFDNFEQFKQAQAKPINKVLGSCVGNWYSYVRSNMAKGYLYASPVKVYVENHKVWLMLKGPERVFKGELRMKSGCLFTMIESEGGKEFHHVYKIGNMVSPNVLQGIFSGVLSVDEPIGGRAVLIRQSVDFEQLENSRLSVEELKSHTALEYRKLADYFQKYEENNLKIGTVRTFEIDDLGD